MTTTSFATASFFDGRPTTEIAQALLGTTLLYRSNHGLIGGLIVETEAYLGTHDTAAHAYKGRRSKFTEPLYRAAGTLYIYQLRANLLFDIVTQPLNVPEGVLIRAIEPTYALDQMLTNRGKSGVQVTNGPGKLAQALGIHDQTYNLVSIDDSPFEISLKDVRHPRQIKAVPRVGVNPDAASGQLPLRFIVAGNPYISDSRKRDWQSDHGWQA
ncbi:DNA-3-methyladenine glycosylase [Lactiplantibacillus garii]|uniref:Putative 3-methyladenine DNA glycosylase n=1 Tax=Lactiplantibacillus garii TaxID=2306423 RepID=A0A3R8J7P9_9LACO|nr:DNA-3-methyladenine glycosylase [Lactiplantibacillus garii]RRK10717.1 DNA-3-methyladenine glycosylase [Lactiplantibacillus garii]